MLTHVRKEARAYLQDGGNALPYPKALLFSCLSQFLGIWWLGRGHRNIHLFCFEGMLSFVIYSYSITVYWSSTIQKNEDQRLLAPIPPQPTITSTPTRTCGRMNLQAPGICWVSWCLLVSFSDIHRRTLRLLPARISGFFSMFFLWSSMAWHAKLMIKPRKNHRKHTKGLLSIS